MLGRVYRSNDLLKNERNLSHVRLYISRIMPLLYIHHTRNLRTTYRARIFRHLRITV